MIISAERARLNARSFFMAQKQDFSRMIGKYIERFYFCKKMKAIPILEGIRCIHQSGSFLI